MNSIFPSQSSESVKNLTFSHFHAYSIDSRIKCRCAESSIHILRASVSSGFHCKSMYMLSQASMHLALLSIWASMWPIKVFDVCAISRCNWSRWVRGVLISLAMTLNQIPFLPCFELKEVTYYSIDRLHKMNTMTTLNEMELRGCNSNQKYPICLGCQLNVPQTTITDSTSLLVNVKHFIQVGFHVLLVLVLTKSRIWLIFIALFLDNCKLGT